MNDFEQKLHRTWVELLLEHNYRELAAIAIDIDIELKHGYDDLDGIAFDIPVSTYSIVKNDDSFREVIERAMSVVCSGHVCDNVEYLTFTYRIKLKEVEEGWQSTVRKLIVSSENSNQGLVTEKAFAKRNKQSYIYNEMKFASKTEIRIAQELEARNVLFFPLPLAVRGDTGNLYEDHREVDFLVCEDGTWGILEVSFHPDRYEKDAEKDAWFKKSGILCIQHYSAETCHKNSEQVVDEFLSILARHKR
jgi:hypothetical protein